MTRVPILIDCEGSGCPGHDLGRDEAMCAMCGNIFETQGPDHEMVPHQRPDILAMLARGDYDA